MCWGAAFSNFFVVIFQNLLEIPDSLQKKPLKLQFLFFCVFITSVFLLQSEYFFNCAIFCPFSYTLGSSWFCFALPVWRVTRKEKIIFVIDWALMVTWSLMCGLKIKFVLSPDCIGEFLPELAILSDFFWYLWAIPQLSKCQSTQETFQYSQPENVTPSWISLWNYVNKRPSKLVKLKILWS